MKNLWNEEEIKFLKENYLEMNDEELASHLSNRTFSAVKTKRKQLKLYKSDRKYNFKDVVNSFNDSKYILISAEEDYINCGIPNLKYICPDHKDVGIQMISYAHFLEGRGCPYCNKDKNIKIHEETLNNKYNEYQELCKLHDFIFKGVVRKKGYIKIQFICPKHSELEIQEMTPYNMKRDLKGCKYCSGKQLPEWYVLKKANEINPYIKLLEPYKNLTTRMQCICTKHNKKTSKTMQEILKGQGCRECGKEKLSEQHFYDIEEIKDKINVFNPHVKLLNYNGITEFADCYCEKHDKYFKKYPKTMIDKKSGCSECYAENLRESQGMGIEEFKKRLKQIHPDVEVIGEYVNNNTATDLYCKKHNCYFSLTPSAMLSRWSCCDKSRVTYKEENMCSLLESWGYRIIRQKIFEDCKDARDLQYDAYLVDFNVVLEYDGEQHFRPVAFGKQSWEEAVEKYEYTVKHDKIKNEYCKKNHIPLIRVPYWEYENMDYYLFDKLEKLNVIIKE